MPLIDADEVQAMHEALTSKQRGILRADRCLSDEIIDRFLIGVTMKFGAPRVAIPIQNVAGEYEDVRCWLHPKRRTSGSPKILHWERGYGGARLYPSGMLKKEELVLVAGELDALALITHGIPAITATSGESSWPERLSQEIAGSGTTKVIVVPDNDETGVKAAQLRGASLHALGLEVRVATWE